MRSRRWFLLPIVLAAAVWFAWTREWAGEGRAGAGDSGTSTSSVESELARPEDRDESDGASGSDRVPAQDTTSGARAERSVSVRLRVLEKASGRPIPGAIVRAFEREFQTDAAGACEIQWPEDEAKRSPKFHVAKAGFLHLWTWLELEPGLEVTLSRDATLSGRVLADDTGAPVAGARLFVALTRCRCPVEIVESDPSGRYELPGVPPRDETTIVIQAQGFPRMEREFELRSDEARIEQDFRLERGVEIAGRVVDFTSGAGVPGATVAGFPADDAGRFRSWVAVERAGEVRVRVSAPDHCRLEVLYDREVLERTGALELRLPRSVAVEGLVHDPAGNPLAGAAIFALQYGSEGPPADDPTRDELPAGWTLSTGSDNTSVESDSTGRFRIDGLLPWCRTTWISADRWGYELAEQRLEDTGAPGSTSWLELALRPEQYSNATKLRGKVRVNGLEGRWEGSLSWKGPTREGRVELEDGFRLEVEPGEVRFHLALDAVPGPIEGDSFVLELWSGADIRHDVELKLPPAPIRGRVRFDDGTPIPQMTVTVSTVSDRGPEYAGARSRTESDQPGRFRVLVFPQDLTIEPAEIVLPVKDNEPVIVRWKRR